MTEEGFLERREVARLLLTADVEVIEQEGGSSSRARVSEISRRGCYVDTLNPCAVSTQVLLRIHHASRSCEVPGKVIYLHAGMGMGVMFGEIADDQMVVLDDWLASLEAASS